jgi:hypothetical protein
MPSKLDWQILYRASEERLKAHALESPRIGFFYVVLSPILGLTAAEIDDAITDGPRDRGIDAFYFDERQGGLELHLFNFKFTDQFENSSHNFPGGEVDKVISFVDELVGLNPALLDSCNELLLPKVQYVWLKFQSPVFRIRIHLCSNALSLAPDQKQRLIARLKRYSYVSILEHHVDEIVDSFLRTRDEPISGKIRMLDTQYFERTDGGVRGLIVTVKANDLVNLIRDSRANGQIRRSLFDENIRVYLGAKNFVNRQIIETASGQNAADFWYLNNGITIVCDKYQFNIGIPGAEIDLENFQIVNGGQTANALFEVAQVDDVRLKNVSVLVRIYETKRSDFKPVIAASTNNQTRIDSRDLKSNDPKQKKLEAGLAIEGYFYERKADQHIDKPLSKRVDALRAGQAYLAYFGKLPDRARTQSDKIFGEWYDNIFDDEISPNRLLTAFRLLQIIDDRKRLTKTQIRAGKPREQSDEFLIEGIFHVLYVIGQLCLRNHIALDDFDQSAKFLDQAINLTRDVSSNFREKSYYRFFRSVDAREILFKKVFDIPTTGTQLPLFLDG